MFQAETVCLKQIQSTLRCIDFSKECTIEITSRGLRFVVEESQSLQGKTSRVSDTLSSRLS